MRNSYLILLVIALVLLPTIIYAQGDLVNQIQTWTQQLKTVARAILGLVAIGGGVYTYFKVQSDDGGSGKKAIGNYVLALVFASLLWSIIEFFIN